jgi:p24 family protein delta-1
MVVLRSLPQYICFLVLAAATTQALKFDLTAKNQHDSVPRCIRNFVAKDTLVVVTAIVSGYKGDGMKVDIHVRLPSLQSDAAAFLVGK